MYLVKTILHPTDFSPLSHNAFELACGLAMQHGARVILLHVAIPPPAAAPMPYDAAALHSETFDEAELRHRLEELRASDPSITMEYVLERGAPGDVILRIAEESECDVIVMGTHGRSGLTRLIMGSVAEQVLRDAPCPVVTVNDPKKPKEEASQRETPVSASK